MIACRPFLFLAVISSSCWAYTPFKASLNEKKNIYIDGGVFTGGKAGTGSSLLKVRRTYSAKSQLERIIVDVGDKDSKPAGKNMGYFQAAVDSARNRLVLDLSQLRISKVTEAQLQGLFKKDAYVASSELTLDPEDKAGTMVLNFKRPVKVEVFHLIKDKMPGRIVMDISPLNSAKR